MQLDQVLDTFIVESRELLDEMETALLALEQNSEQAEMVNAVFRAAHTIKGSAGLFGLDHIVAFTHAVESVLDRVRDGLLLIDGQLIALLLACSDHIGMLINGVERKEMTADEASSRHGEPLLAQLRSYLGERSQPAAASASACAGHWHISVRFGEDVLRNGMDPISFIRYLGTLGEIKAIATVADALPSPESMDPESCYLGFEIALESAADQSTIENTFEFVRDDCQLRILPPNSGTEDCLRLVRESHEGGTELAGLFTRCGCLTPLQLKEACPDERLRQGSRLENAPGAGQNAARQVRSQESRSIRIDADKLDQLINLVGELIIAGASVNLIARAAQLSELQESASKLSSLVEEVRDSALQLRMVKIEATLNRFRRVVHDVAQEMNKDIRLVIEGEETELDKTVVEMIGDPLMHLVRNAVDHGIEMPQERLARGKSAAGTVKLAAYHDSGSIVIEVSDDGGGLRRDRILAKAIERGLVEPGKSLPDNDIYALLFEPGFSTADKITSLSGRGVGLDVVKRNITALRGSVEVNSVAGEGTTFTVRLPLTLAIIDGFLVGVGKSVFAIPLDMIDECVAFSAAPGHSYTDLRGQVLPFIRLRDMFDIPGASARRENIVVIKHGGKKAGLVVDSLLGEFQTVIKPISKIFSRIRCISGSTILGNGEVALILDVPSLVQHAGAPGNTGMAVGTALNE